MMMMMMRCTSLLWVLLAPSLLLSVATATDEKKDNNAAMMRLLKASFSVPNADTASIISDAKTIFGDDVIDSTVVEELFKAKTANTATTCVNAASSTETGKTQPNEEIIGSSSSLLSSLFTYLSSWLYDSSSSNKHQADNNEIPPYADRHAKRIASVRNDFDCMEREFDMQSDAFDPKEAAAVLFKCRLLVVRNIWPPSLIAEYKANVSNYISQLKEGKISKKGTTTLGEKGFWAHRNDKRFDIVFPEYLKNEKIFANEKVKQIMIQPKALGKDFIINSIGTVIAESGAAPGGKHYDDAYLVGDESFPIFSLAGTDLPPWAVTMFFPASNMTIEQGPTEFCMGTNHFKGLVKGRIPPLQNRSLFDTDVTRLHRFESIDYGYECPEEFKRAPLLNVGDAIFFDYTITHHGGANTSPDLRAMLYVSYSRYFYRDSNFEIESLPGQDELVKGMTDNDIRTQSTRFAIVSGGDRGECNGQSPCPERVPLESISNFMGVPGEQRKTTVKFEVTNDNLIGASLYTTVGSQEKHLANVAVGETIKLEIYVGSKLLLWRDGDEEDKDDWLWSWEIKQDQGPIVLKSSDFAPRQI